MKKSALLIVLLLVPTLTLAQGIKVTSMYPPAELRSAAGAEFVKIDSSLPTLDIGDEIRTGPGGSMTLELPDGSYVVVSENTTLTIEKFWGSDIKNLMRVVLGKARFFIQRWGGRPNPYRVNTPTALIAVRGTTFEVSVDSKQATEVYCFDGRVTVETAGLSDREVILDAGRKTRVLPGQYPLTPVAIDADFGGTRILELVRKSDETEPELRSAPGFNGVLTDNDRRNRTLGPLSNPQTNRSVVTPEIRRGKLSYPR
jgi:ferric-dicitrate binding protein FerR (iron transport regulator)